VVLSDLLKESDGRSSKGLIVEKGAVAINETIQERLKIFLRNRENEAAQQGQLIFADCTDIPLFGTLQLNSDSVENLPKLIAGRVIVYETRHYMPGMKYSISKKVSFTPKAPHLDYFWGVYKEGVLGNNDQEKIPNTF